MSSDLNELDFVRMPIFFVWSLKNELILLYTVINCKLKYKYYILYKSI